MNKFFHKAYVVRKCVSWGVLLLVSYEGVGGNIIFKLPVPHPLKNGFIALFFLD